MPLYPIPEGATAADVEALREQIVAREGPETTSALWGGPAPEPEPEAG